jgi:hypothetical protein
MTKRSNPFRGRWRIVSTDVWNSRSLDEFQPARLTFGPRQTGELNLIAINASIDYRISISGGSSRGVQLGRGRRRKPGLGPWMGRDPVLGGSSATSSFTKATKQDSRRQGPLRNELSVAVRAAAMTDDRDAAVRLRAFDFLTDQRRRLGEASIPPPCSSAGT